jgi:elongation factor Ts
MSLELIKKLREQTGAGMADCQVALKESGGDIDKAIEILRKKGIAKAAKRGDREASEGIILLEVNDAKNEGYVLEINAETDFVAKNESFQNLAREIMEVIKAEKPKTKDELMSKPMGKNTVEESLGSLSGTIGEKMGIKDMAILSSSGTVASYSHMGGKIGVLVSLDQAKNPELAKTIAMQIAAASPKYIKPEDVPEEELNKEKEIYREQLIKEGKPENIIDKIIEGKINKYYEEVCLVAQEYIKDDKKKVAEILGDIKVEQFARFSLDAPSQICG